MPCAPWGVTPPSNVIREAEVISNWGTSPGCRAGNPGPDTSVRSKPREGERAASRTPRERGGLAARQWPGRLVPSGWCRGTHRDESSDEHFVIDDLSVGRATACGPGHLQGMDVVQGTTGPVWKTANRTVRRQNRGGRSGCIRGRRWGLTALRPYIGDGQLKERGVRRTHPAFPARMLEREELAGGVRRTLWTEPLGGFRTVQVPRREIVDELVLRRFG